MATSQHRCVFVGNIPYDATEEQLIDICNEVGPVVSFRLVTDRDTGKPKGYGFCEYKDEETALSARRNLQGYEINGRQLRVDFAENDKASDKSREQGRGGPGLAPTADPSKQVGAPALLGDASQYQPVGLQIAMSAAAAIAGALGGAQGQLALANDPLTLHLAKLSRIQLNEILYDMKIMATQSKELSRQLLLTRPQLSKALFQAQIMLGMVTPQVLQMPNLLQAPGPASQTPFKGNLISQLPVAQVSALPPLAQSSMQSALLPKVHESQVSTVPQNALARSQVSAPQQFSLQPRAQLPPHANEHALQQAALLGNSLVSPFPPLQYHSSSSLSIRPQSQGPTTSFNQQIPSSSLNNSHLGAKNLGHNSQRVHSNATMQPSVLPRHSDTRYQPGPSISSGILQPTGRSAEIVGEGTQGNRNMSNSNFPTGLVEKKRLISPVDSVAYPSKLRKLGNGSVQPQVSGIASSSMNLTPKTEAQHYETQMKTELPSGVAESALLEQVLKLTPEQLSSLSPEQKQQVIQLQQMLRREQTQPS